MIEYCPWSESARYSGDPHREVAMNLGMVGSGVRRGPILCAHWRPWASRPSRVPLGNCGHRLLGSEAEVDSAGLLLLRW